MSLDVPHHSASMTALARPGTTTVALGARARRLVAVLVPAVIGLLTLVVFAPALDNGFVDWDDSVLIVKNEAYRGLGWPQLRWMFSTILMGHYVPVTWLTLGADYVLWGMDPVGYHFTNLLLHAANAVLWYFVALRLLRAATAFTEPTLRLAAAASALFFAWHPLRVESVVWVTERRDVLSGCFFFATLLLYLQARERDGAARVGRHVAACVCYLLAILSKSMVMTLPALLVLLDVYPFRRLDLTRRTWALASVWREKVPYIALGLLAAMLGYWAQAANRFITSADQMPWSSRPLLVAHSLWFYASKTLMPLNLSPLYELPLTIRPFAPRFFVPALVVAGATLGLVVVARRWPAGLAVMAAYAITLAPVAGIVHSGHQLTHDRYSYLACLSFAVLVGAGVGWVRQIMLRGLIRPTFGRMVGVVLAGWFAALALLTWHQAQAWRDAETLWRHATDATPECSVCELNLGTALLNRNDLDAALGHFERALGERPDRWKGYHNLGLTLARQGEITRATEHFRRVVETRPDDAGALMNLGVSMMKLRRPGEGVGYLRRAANLAPNDVLILTNLGTALMETHKPDEGIGLFRRAIAVDPTAPQPRYALLQALLGRGDLRAARREHAFLSVVDRRAAHFIGPALLEAW
jgi:Flp pilus assembly protein TadD